MVAQEVHSVLRFLRACLEDSGVNVSRMILFGSHARGAGTAESDIDVAVVSATFRRRGVFECADLVKDAHAKVVERFVVPLEIVPMTPEELEGQASPVAQFVAQGVSV